VFVSECKVASSSSRKVHLSGSFSYIINNNNNNNFNNFNNFKVTQTTPEQRTGKARD
jgi:hypothetical protein